MERLQASDFYNDGFGWICRHCAREFEQNTEHPGRSRSRLMREGEAETKTPLLSNRALAKWADPAQRTLICPHCGITELIDKF